MAVIRASPPFAKLASGPRDLEVVPDCLDHRCSDQGFFLTGPG